MLSSFPATSRILWKVEEESSLVSFVSLTDCDLKKEKKSEKFVNGKVKIHSNRAY